MKTFPMFLQVSGRKVVIVGGGEQAAQKARLILKTDADVILLAGTLEPELADLAATGRVTHDTGPVTPSSFTGAALVFVATGCPGADMALHALAKEAGTTVNVVDQPHLCDAITPSIVDRDPVIVAIGTEGTAPVLARQIKTKVEEILEPRLGDLAALAGRLRQSAARHLSARRRRDLWRWVFNGTPRQLFAAGAERDAARMIKDAISTGVFEDATAGSVSLVGAGPGAKDLITLRGVQRLQEADVIYYDRLLDPEILELARRDAERIYVGKAPGCHSWPQDKITQTLVAAAERGQRVVRLKCGDPGIFARSTEEIDALKSHGIAYEIVPGVTAACAAAAAAGESLTERGQIDTLILATGHVEQGYKIPDAIRNMRPGTCVAIYMGVGAAAQIARHFTLTQPDATLEVSFVAQAQRKGQITATCPIDRLPQALADHGITSAAILFFRQPSGSKAAKNASIVQSHGAAAEALCG